MMNKYLRLIADRKFRFNLLANKGIYNFMPDEKLLAKQYELSYGKKPELDSPGDFNEKLLWLKLHDRRPEYREFTDKASFPGYIRRVLGEGHTVPRLGGPWDCFDDIDFDVLPESFVLKCTHDSGSVFVCRDKSRLDMKALRRKFDKCMRRDYYCGKREWQYKGIKPGIIAEEFLDSGGNVFYDYKIMCFNGKARMLFLCSDIVDENGQRTKEECGNIFDRDFQPLPVRETIAPLTFVPEKPANWEEMISLAEKLAQGMPILRVDMYNVNGRIYIGELTLHHNAGLDNVFDPPEWAEIMGSWIELP